MPGHFGWRGDKMTRQGSAKAQSVISAQADVDFAREGEGEHQSRVEHEVVQPGEAAHVARRFAVGHECVFEGLKTRHDGIHTLGPCIKTRDPARMNSLKAGVSPRTKGAHGGPFSRKSRFCWHRPECGFRYASAPRATTPLFPGRGLFAPGLQHHHGEKSG